MVCLGVETIANNGANEHFRAAKRLLERNGLDVSGMVGLNNDNCTTMMGATSGFQKRWHEELKRPLLKGSCALHFNSLALHEFWKGVGGPRPTGPVAVMWGAETGCHMENVVVALYQCCGKEGRREATRARLAMVLPAGKAPQDFKNLCHTRWGSSFDATDVLLPASWGGQLEATIEMLGNMDAWFKREKYSQRMRNLNIWIRSPKIQLQLFMVSMFGKKVGRPTMNWLRGKGHRFEEAPLPCGRRLQEIGYFFADLIRKLKG